MIPTLLYRLYSTLLMFQSRSRIARLIHRLNGREFLFVYRVFLERECEYTKQVMRGEDTLTREVEVLAISRIRDWLQRAQNMESNSIVHAL